MEMIVKFLPLFGILALGFVFWKNAWVAKQEEGGEKMSRIAKNIADGAMSFLKAEYKVLAIFVAAVTVLLYFKGSSEEGSNAMVAVSFIVGAICSALAGFIGMKAATKANVRTTQAARTSLGSALEVAFAGGAVMGLGVVGLGVLGLSGLFMFYSGQGWELNEILNVLSGFSSYSFKPHSFVADNNSFLAFAHYKNYRSNLNYFFFFKKLFHLNFY